MLKWLINYIKGASEIKSMEALHIYRCIVLAAKPLTLQEIQASTPVMPQYLPGILATLVRNGMLIVIDQDGSQQYGFSPDRFRPSGPRPIP